MGTEYIAVVVTIAFTIADQPGHRPVHVQGVHGPAHAARSGVRADRAAGAARRRCRSGRRADLEAIRRVAARVERRDVAGDLRDRLAAGRAAAEPGRHRPHGADAVVQHHLELRDQHEPPALQRRDRAVVLLADVRDHVPAVRDRGHGHGGVHRDDSRPGRQPAGHARQLLRRLHAGDGAGAAAAGAAGGDDHSLAGHADDLRGRGAGHDTSKGPSRSSPAAWRRPRWRSSSSAPTAAATSARTRRIPTRTRRR